MVWAKPFHSDYVIIGLVVKDFGFFEKQTPLICVLLKQLFDIKVFPTTVGSENGSNAVSFDLFLVAELLPSKFW